MMDEKENLEQDFISIHLDLRFKLGTVNCFLLKTKSGFVLIDTGGTNNRLKLEEALGKAGCTPGHLLLIILTHGDFDHIGNAAYLRQKYVSKIAMHPDDFGMIAFGDMFWNRTKPNILIKLVAGSLFKLSVSDRVKPDLALTEGHDLSSYGLNAKIVHLPGHSKGSIGLITSSGDLFCGDLFENTKGPALNSIMDDMETALLSVEKLKNMKVKTVYPGHGRKFSLEQYLQNKSSGSGVSR